MSKMSDLPLYGYTVHTVAPVGMTVEKHAITAAYLQEEGAYTFFKDPGHSVIGAYRTELVAHIVRTEKPVGYTV